MNRKFPICILFQCINRYRLVNAVHWRISITEYRLLSKWDQIHTLCLNKHWILTLSCKSPGNYDGCPVIVAAADLIEHFFDRREISYILGYHNNANNIRIIKCHRTCWWCNNSACTSDTPIYWHSLIEIKTSIPKHIYNFMFQQMWMNMHICTLNSILVYLIAVVKDVPKDIVMGRFRSRVYQVVE